MTCLSLGARQSDGWIQHRELPSHLTYDICSWEILQDLLITNVKEEGEAHGRVKPPKGSEFTSIKIGKQKEEAIPVFRTKASNMSSIEHLFIVLHGKRRDGDHYWSTMHKAISDARENDSVRVKRKTMVIAPQFFSKTYNSGQYTKNQLAWGDINTCQAGLQAVHPKGTNMTSIDVLDGLAHAVSNKSTYPSMTNITIVGHGGGGQLSQRYAAVGKDGPEYIHI
ncbi:unnamed protein product [Clonostachys rhizophaga]|uniref:Uncharacterized protein n=1 Tax=Clonostachys rhizophaga TaxID=160324 RepID=A0A9N9YIC3_9HYPO|nr:unnamed protein product [Clonostachys rhizophaga]